MKGLLRAAGPTGALATTVLATIGLALLASGCATPPGSIPPAATPSAVAAVAPRDPAPVDPQAPLLPPPALRVEGVPPLTQGLLLPMQRYAGVVGHSFAGWHPQRREMLVSYRAPGQSTAQLYRLRAPLAPLERLLDSAEPVQNPQWEPGRGRYLLLERGSGGDEAYQVFRLDPPGAGAAPVAAASLTQITRNGERHAVLGWLTRTGQALIGSVPLDRTAAGGSRGEVTTRVELVDPLAVTGPDSTTGRRVVAELPGGGWFGVRVSPDQQQVVLTRYFSATHSEVWRLDVATGQRQRLLPREGETLRATHYAAGWSSDSRSLYVISNRASEFLELMRFPLDGGEPQRLTGHIPWDVNEGDLSPQSPVLAMTVNVDGRDELRLFDRATGAEQPLPKVDSFPPGSVTRVRRHPGTGEFAIVVNSSHGPSQVHSLDIANGRTTVWTQPTAPRGLDLTQIPAQQIVRWPGFDGRSISGVLSLPPARFTGKRPVLMLMHGGPESQSKQGWNGRLNYLLMERGVALLEPNVRGSSGYGKTFLELDNGRLREDAVKDMASAIDWVATHPRLDGGKVVVSGGSYGGYMALAAATRLSNRIAGAVSAVGISNFVSFLENTESYRRDLRRVEYGDERDPAMREFLLSISPLTHAGQITKPLMVVQGRNDPRVPWTESEQIVRRLQQRGVPVWYLLADNEGHGFARRENADFYLATLVKFLEQTVIGPSSATTSAPTGGPERTRPEP